MGRKLALTQAENVISTGQQKTFAQAIRSGRTGAWIFVVILMVGIGFEYQFWWPLPTEAGIVPEPIAALATRTDIRAVLDIPWYHPLVNKDGMFLQTGHHQPMIIGQISRRSPIDPAKVNLLQDTLDPALLDAAGVDVVILHKEYDGSNGAVGTFTRSTLGKPFYEDAQYAVFDVPKYTGGAAGFVSDIQGDTIYFYAPQAGQATVSGRTGDNSGSLALDSRVILTWGSVRGPQDFLFTIGFAAGYHAITVSNDPICPIADDPALACPVIQVEGLALEGYKAN